VRHHDNRILLSASDLMRFIDCRHATALDLRRLRGEALTPAADSEDAALLQAHGDAHEAAHLAALKASGRRVVEVAREGHDLAAGVTATRAALADGPDVVFQGALAGGVWGGWSDFLERVEKPSALGGFSYEVTDTKLKRNADPKHVLQLVLYSDLLAELQGAAPEHAHVALGGGGRATIRLQDYAGYARRARARLEAFVADPRPTEPVPVAACALCRWRDHCAGHWAATDSLFQVANITRAQVAKLTAAGITTMRALGERRARAPRLADATLEKLATQARLQTGRSDGGGPAFALRAHQPGKGFDLLPRPDPGDLFYDIEGDPFVEGGLEYLHGVWAEDAGFRAFWAHDHAEERARLGELMDFLDARLTAHPRASIHHYAPYEITALRRLTTRYGVGEARLDRWLRERRFVDLYAVVRGAIIASDPRQLPQVIQGAHPPPADRSALEWLLGDAATVPADRGIFLPVSRRMHPDLCGFVSAQVYEGRLDSHPDTARQRIDGAGALPPHGAHLVFVEHAGRAQEAPEEVAAIAATIDRLLGAQVTGRDGVRRPLRLRDVIVVAPYNAQVNALIDALPPGAQVGTVDKFQGKEAAVCLVSMTSSSAEDTPRGLDFLFSLNRINVAVSRAKALCLVFASPRLLEARCATIEDMRLVNTLCALAEHAPPLTWRGNWP
jgi:predicted RecB family nuclease